MANWKTEREIELTQVLYIYKKFLALLKYNSEITEELYDKFFKLKDPEGLKVALQNQTEIANSRILRLKAKTYKIKNWSRMSKEQLIRKVSEYEKRRDD